MKFCVALLLVGCVAAAPAKPKLITSFSATIDRVEEIYQYEPPIIPKPINKTTRANLTVAAESKGSAPGFRMAQYAMPFEKTLTNFMDCNATAEIWPFFDENVCWKFPHKAEPVKTCEEMVEQQISFQILQAEMYTEAIYNRSETVNGKEVLVFSVYHEEHRVINETINGTVYHIHMDQLMDIGFFVTSSGQLVKFSQLQSSKLSGGPNPVEERMSTVDTWSGFISPPPPKSYEIPSTCIDLGVDYQPNAVRANDQWYKNRVNDPDVIEAINKEDLGWTAGENDYMAGKPLWMVSSTLGSFAAPDVPLSTVSELTEEEIAAIPATFDSRTQWPKCPTIGTIRNQGGCGSCWAFGATETLEDRICIHSQAAQTPVLSPEFLIDCDEFDGNCGGGFLDNAWHALQRIGLCLEDCDPYQHCAYPKFANCTPPRQSEFEAAPGIPECPKQCKDGSALKLFYADTAYPVAKPGDVAKIQQEIMTNGPIEVAFFVYSDFMQYKSGVYQKSKTAQGPMGGHAVKFVGWGEDNGTPFWLVANSWSPTWGEIGGYFKIIRGKNECGIESTPAAGIPKA